jgi:hypothetical protein
MRSWLRRRRERLERLEAETEGLIGSLCMGAYSASAPARTGGQLRSDGERLESYSLGGSHASLPPGRPAGGAISDSILWRSDRSQAVAAA